MLQYNGVHVYMCEWVYIFHNDLELLAMVANVGQVSQPTLVAIKSTHHCEALRRDTNL